MVRYDSNSKKCEPGRVPGSLSIIGRVEVFVFNSPGSVLLSLTVFYFSVVGYFGVGDFLLLAGSQ